MASLTGVATDFISVSVGDHCDTPRCLYPSLYARAPPAGACASPSSTSPSSARSGARGAAFAALTLDISCATSEHVKLLRPRLADAFADAPSASFLLGIALC